MSDIVIDKFNDVHAIVKCNESIAHELNDHFKFRVPNFQFHPLFRTKQWDGYLHIFKKQNRLIYSGLTQKVIDFALARDYEITYNTDLLPDARIDKETVEKWITTWLKPHKEGKRIKPWDNQITGIWKAINHTRAIFISPTGSGKSLFIYGIIRYLDCIIEPGQKILIVVPTTSLVEQMYNDFEDYAGPNSKWKVEDECHRIYTGKEKQTDKTVVITTWQSIYRKRKDFFDQFSAVVGDECHHYKAKSLIGIMEKLHNCPYRIGCTGTLDGIPTNKLVIQGLFGPIHRLAKTQELIEENKLAKLKIDCILLQYPESERKETHKLKYIEELKWITQHNKRNQFIRDLSLTIPGNTLVLFQYVEKHGEPLHELIKKSGKKTGRKVFFVSGKVHAKEREEIRKIVNKEKNAIIVASYGTFSTGINIENLSNIIFASPSKSRIRVLQSIGRQLRKSETKSKARLFDIADDLQIKSYKNHTLKHNIERIKLYNEERFPYNIRKVNL